MKDEADFLTDTRMKSQEHFLNGWRGYLVLRCGNKRMFTFCCTKDTHEDGSVYEHVSVSVANSNTKLPTWEEMCEVKDLFWRKDEEVHQIHPAEGEYVHGAGGLTNVLHLWRPAAGWKW